MKKLSSSFSSFCYEEKRSGKKKNVKNDEHLHHPGTCQNEKRPAFVAHKKKENSLLAILSPQLRIIHDGFVPAKKKKVESLTTSYIFPPDKSKNNNWKKKKMSKASLKKTKNLFKGISAFKLKNIFLKKKLFFISFVNLRQILVLPSQKKWAIF